jgi:hypothetical protein
MKTLIIAAVPVALALTAAIKIFLPKASLGTFIVIGSVAGLALISCLRAFAVNKETSHEA